MRKADRVRRYLEWIAPEDDGLESAAAPDVGTLYRVESAAGTDREKEVALEGLERTVRREELSDDEGDALEAIIIPGERPAVDIVDGHFDIPDHPFGHYAEEGRRARIEAAIPSVGRLEVPDHPTLPYAGTGFVVGDGLLMTNRHVAELFALGLGREGLRFRSGLSPDVDFLRERGSDASAMFDVVRVIMVHPHWDMALLEVSGLDDGRPPLKLSVVPPGHLSGREIAVIGYPALDPRNDVELQNRIFDGAFNVKRLQPGRLRDVSPIRSFGHEVAAITHDSSTLGGNSGSATIDVETGHVVALHFAGIYLEANYAVPTYELARDPRVVNACVNFDGLVGPGTTPWDLSWEEADPAPVETRPPAVSTAPLAAGPLASNAVPESDGTARWTVPIEVTIRIGDPVTGGQAGVTLGVGGREGHGARSVGTMARGSQEGAALGPPLAFVDVHCHNFNGDDIPVKGFVRRVGGTKTSLVKLIDDVIDSQVQGRAPGFDEEMQEIQKRLTPGIESLEAIATESDLDAETEAALAAYRESAGDLVEEARAELAVESDSALQEGAEEGLFDVFGDVKRWIRWALLFAKHRVSLTEMLATTYTEVGLFTPMLVDLEMGLGDPPETPVREQLEMQAAISRVSMLSKLRGRPGARVHPFVGFDPRRPDGVALVQRAVANYGCVGVKMYPPMGFRPLGNATPPVPSGMTAAAAAEADARLREFYAFCASEQVPVTAHGNPTNYADSSYQEYSSPELWELVLTEFPDLHLNLGHFGGSGEGSHGDWPAKIVNLANRFPHLYADVGNHNLDKLDDYLAMLKRLFIASGTTTMLNRLMFGTDWYMVANHRRFEDFLTEFNDAYGQAFPESQYPGAQGGFMGNNALRFLGFDDANNKNAQRLAKRYHDLNAPKPGWLAL